MLPPFVQRSPIPTVVLCGASILNAFLRGEPNQIVVSSVEASRVLEQAAPACQQCLDQLGERLPRSTGNKASDGRGTRTSVHLPLHIRYGLVTRSVFEVVYLSPEIVSWPAGLGCHGVVMLGEASWGCRSSYENITVILQSYRDGRLGSEGYSGKSISIRTQASQLCTSLPTVDGVEAWRM